MAPVKVSKNFQVVIPKDVRESLKIKPGDELRVVEFDGMIELVPVRPIKSLRGRYKGIDTRVVS